MSTLRYILVAYALPILISLGLGIVFWRTTGDKPASLIFTLLVNLTIIVIFDLGRYVKGSSQYIEMYSQFFERDSLRQIAATLRQVQDRRVKILRQVAEQILSQCIARLAYLKADQWTFDSMKEFVDFSDLLFSEKFTKKSYTGVSVISDFSSFWQTPYGMRFFQQNCSACDRGVSIKRIFIFDSEESVQQGEPLLNGQHEKGIEPYFIVKSKVGAGTPLHDFGVWDETIAVVLQEPRHLGAEFRAHFHYEGEKTKELTRYFRTLLNIATKYEPRRGELR